ncbi:MAG: phosphate ABC transporter substrate-binding protein [Chloroflexaceae bacterium]|nr:phosphate ABC transporter substrate-binding protein [Chloroflexaceae bacterium]
MYRTLRNQTIWIMLIVGFLGSCAGGELAPSVQSEHSTTSTNVPLGGELSISGSTTTEPLVQTLRQAFQTVYPNVSFAIEAHGSSFGVTDVLAGNVDIGMSSRALTAEEQQQAITAHPIALDAIAVIVHPSNPVQNVSLGQVRGMFTGEITNWQIVGGNNQPVVPVIRQETSGTRATFDELVLQGATYTDAVVPQFGTVSEAGEVAVTSGAIGYISLGHVHPDQVKVLAIDHSIPGTETVVSGAYPLQRPLLLLTGPFSRELAHTFIDFSLSDAGQQVVANAGWVPIRIITE